MSTKKEAVTGTGAPHWSEKYELVVGLEVHAQLITNSKAYSSDPNAYGDHPNTCLLYTSPSPRDRTRSRMPSSA